IGREEVGVQQYECPKCATGGAEPIRPVDDEIDLATYPGGDELVDRGVDGRVLATDTRTSHESCEVEVPRREGERGCHGGQYVHGERDDEQLLAAEPVGELTEEQGTEAGSDDVDRGRRADLAGAELDSTPILGEAGGDAADHRDFETVENPHAAQADDADRKSAA